MASFDGAFRAKLFLQHKVQRLLSKDSPTDTSVVDILTKVNAALHSGKLTEPRIKLIGQKA